MADTLADLIAALHAAAKAMSAASPGAHGPATPPMGPAGPTMWRPGMPGPPPLPYRAPGLEHPGGVLDSSTPDESRRFAKAREGLDAPDYARQRQGLEAFTKALSNPAKVLEDMAEAGGRFAPAAAFAAGALRTIGALRGAYGSVQGVMERGNPNMAGQMQGTIDLMANRLAGVLSPAIEKLNAGLQGLTDAKPGASIGGGIGAVSLPMVVLAVLAVMGGPVSMTAAAAMAVVGLFAGSMIGSWLSGEKALPSTRGLPQPSVGDRASDWYDQAMMKSLSLQAGTLEAELARRQIELLAAQIGLLTSIDNSIRGSGPEFR